MTHPQVDSEQDSGCKFSLPLGEFYVSCTCYVRIPHVIIFQIVTLAHSVMQPDFSSAQSIITFHISACTEVCTTIV